MREIVVGIDLGTSNSSIAVMAPNGPRLIEIEGARLLPSVVSLKQDGGLLIGQAARNQRHLFPEQTISSVKRKIGSAEMLSLGDEFYSPVEISALILRRLKLAAEAELGGPVTRAVITVPAYFTNAQRSATREAGLIAGLKVQQIINEPTAAALCYVFEEQADRTVMVYDLGGGTFDVSIIRTRGEITEVLSSTGNMALGGDDFDALILTLLSEEFLKKNGADPREDLRAKARLFRVAEETKISLSTLESCQISEEHLLRVKAISKHLQLRLERESYEELIHPLLQKTKDSVQLALSEAGILAQELDEVILVGGATRTPIIAKMLEDLLGKGPRIDINPDEAVTIGATLHAARLAGDDEQQILVDVTPYSFGTNFFDHENYNLDAYKVIIRRNTVLPCKQADLFYTIIPGQTKIDVKIFQGEDPSAAENLLLGNFMVEGLDKEAPANSPIIFELALDLNGILEVEVTEQETGLKKQVTIKDAFREFSDEEIEQARQRLEHLLPGQKFEGAHQALEPPQDLSPEERSTWMSTLALLKKAERLLPKLEEVDAEELRELVEETEQALSEKRLEQLNQQSSLLADTLFYLE